MMMTYDVAVVGGGPAGLQCALLLARARRSVIVLDADEPRNGTVRQAHGFFSRDGIAPESLLTIGREQLEPYEDVRYERARVLDARRIDGGFHLETDAQTNYGARRIVIATGMRDRLPEIDGLDACWGRSVFVCPYCDGWEVRDRPLAVWGNTRSGVGLAQELFQWSRDIVVCADVRTPITDADRAWLAHTGVSVADGAIARLDHENGMLRAIELENGERLERSALFMSVGLSQCCDLAESLGCSLTEKGTIDVDVEYRTSVPGIYAIGDSVSHMHQIVFAAASGARAAIAINTELTGISVGMATTIPDLRTTPPRSGKETLGRYAWLARLADKARAENAGTNGDYVAYCPMSMGFLNRAGVSEDDFERLIEEGASDEQLISYFDRNVSDAQRESANRYILDEHRSSIEAQDAEEGR